MVHSLRAVAFPICVLLLDLAFASVQDVPQVQAQPNTQEHIKWVDLVDKVTPAILTPEINVECEDHAYSVTMKVLDISFEILVTVSLPKIVFGVQFKINARVVAQFKVDDKVLDCIDIPMPGLLHACVKFHDIRATLLDFNICADLHLYRTFDYFVIYLPCISSNMFTDGTSKKRFLYQKSYVEENSSLE